MTPEVQNAFEEQVAELENAARVPVMRECIQHGQVTTWAHCVRVARAAVSIAEALHLRVSQRELVRAALLHDYFLYDWHEPNHTKHATMHPVFALENARVDFDLTPLEENAIAAHMWPLPPGRVPASREAWLICAADKWCSLGETLFMR
ncbi:HD domain-containing protein [Paratractidigestivibacter sp.]|uniref:HD domain-containing protein n=1 Tax=Paratractidigestivibacter sp. TaxID=2847316 RepID=UPI002ABD953C|nr:HD domain-containing protein [Paratractidigestivibacter sp.]